MIPVGLEERWNGLLARATKALQDAHKADQSQSDEEVLNALLWRAFCLGVDVLNYLHGAGSQVIELDFDDASSLRAKATEIRAKISMWEGLYSRLREIAEGEPEKGPERLGTAVDDIMEEMDTRDQELARRLIKFLDQKDPVLREFFRSESG